MNETQAAAVEKKKSGPRRKTRCMFKDARGRWWLDFYDPAGRRRRKLAGNSKQDADRLLRQIRTSVDRGEYVDARKSPGFSDFCATFHALHGQHHSSYCDAAGQWRIRSLKKFFGNIKLSSITPEMIEQYRLGRLAKPVARQTVNREIVALRAVLSKAVKLGKLARNPAGLVEDYKSPERRDRCLSRAEIVRLLRATKSSNSPILRPAVFLALKTGLRKSELFGLKWSDVDFEAGQLLIRKSKTGKPRCVVLSRSAQWLLKTMLARVVNPLNAVWVFETIKQDGSVGPATDVKTGWKTALLAAGIHNFHFHDLRHTFASHHVMNGMNIYALAAMLGHANPTMTLKTYAHLSPEFIAQQRAVMNRRPFAAARNGHLMDTNAQSESVSN